MESAYVEDLNFLQRTWAALKATAFNSPYFLGIYLLLGFIGVAFLFFGGFILTIMPAFLSLLILIPAFFFLSAAMLCLNVGFFANCLAVTEDEEARPNFVLAFSGFRSLRPNLFITFIWLALGMICGLLGIEPVPQGWLALALIIPLGLFLTAYSLYLAHHDDATTGEALRGALGVFAAAPHQWLLNLVIVLVVAISLAALGALPLLLIDQLGFGGGGRYSNFAAFKAIQLGQAPPAIMPHLFKVMPWPALAMNVCINFVAFIFSGILSALTFWQFAQDVE